MEINFLEDEKIKSFKESYEKGNYDLNTDKLIKEIQQAHIVRNVRLLRSEDISENINIVIDAVAQNQSIRSRIVEIKMDCTRVCIKLKFKKESLINYLYAKYREELKSLKGTQADRNAFIQELFSFITPSLTRLQVLQDFCDLVLNDIDQASWALKSIIDCLKINDASKGIIT